MEIYDPFEVHFAALAVEIHGRIHSHEILGWHRGGKADYRRGMCPPLPLPGDATGSRRRVLSKVELRWPVSSSEWASGTHAVHSCVVTVPPTQPWFVITS